MSSVVGFDMQKLQKDEAELENLKPSYYAEDLTPRRRAKKKKMADPVAGLVLLIFCSDFYGPVLLLQGRTSVQCC
jgi:hypothetical protein